MTDCASAYKVIYSFSEGTSDGLFARTYRSNTVTFAEN